MRLPRPYIPYDVRVQVAARQIIEAGLTWATDATLDALPESKKLHALLLILFCDDEMGHLHLDHDPALVNRKKIYRNGAHVDYDPPANDPRYLVYRTRQDHDIKTRVRGDGAQRSDLAQRRYLKRVARNRSPDKPKKKIPQRKNFEWPKRPSNKRG